MGINGNDYVRVARIGKPHGIRGEVTVQIFTDSPQTRFVAGSSLKLHFTSGTNAPFTSLTIEEARWNKKILLLKFLELDDRTAAESVRGAELYAVANDPLDDREGWFAHHLLGFAVHVGNLDASQIGTVTNLVVGEAQDLLEIRLATGREVLIPFVQEIVPNVDEELGALVITPPPGLLELNQD